jgi:hypothetical protein
VLILDLGLYLFYGYNKNYFISYLGVDWISLGVDWISLGVDYISLGVDY